MSRPAHSGRRRRRWQLAVIVGCVLLLAFMAADLFRWRLSDQWIALRQEAWSERVDACEALFAQGRFEEAAERLRALDQRFPARHPKHALVRERERLLRLLARAEEAGGHRKRARRSWKRLSEYEERNVLNHFERAEALVRMGRGSDAIGPLEKALEIAPDHLGATRLLMELHDDAARWPKVERAWLDYLDALRFERFDLRRGSSATHEWVQVDGRSRVIHFDLMVPPNAGPFELRWPRGTIGVESASCRLPRRVGEPSEDPIALVPSPGRGTEVESPGRFRPAGDEAGRLVLAVPGSVAGPHRVVLRLRAFKDSAAKDRARARRAMRNLLHFSELDALAPRLAKARKPR